MNSEERRMGDPDRASRSAGAVWIGLALVAAVTAGAIGRDPVMGLIAGDEAASSEDDIGEALRYTCGMHPHIVQDEPGICPVCEMKLTPMQGGDSEGKGGISINPRIRQNMGIRTRPVRTGPLVKRIRTVGHVDFDERRLANISTKVEGWVERLFVDFTGQPVEKGQRLLSLYSPVLVATQEELLLAYKRHRQSKSARDETLWKAARERLRYWDISLAQIRRIESTGKVQRTLTIHAPVDGVVVNKEVVKGQHVTAGAALFAIADLSEVWVYVHVYEMDVPFVKVGQKVEVTLPYDESAALPAGRVDYVFPWLDPRTRDVKARVVFDNKAGLLKPEMYVTAILHADLGRVGLLVDDSAIIRSGTRNVAFVEGEPGSFDHREIELGVHLDGEVEVLKGLSRGDAVVVNGQFMLDSESRLKEALDQYGGGSVAAVGDHDHGVHGQAGHGVEKPERKATPLEALDALSLEGCTHTCPMPSHFHICGTEPGRCPDCNMNLKPIEDVRKRFEVAP